jgi:hypothetical protein
VPASQQGESRTLGNIRRAILALVVLGTVGTVIELLLIGHYEDTNQLIPLGVAALGLAAIAWTLLAPGIVALRALQFVMLLFAGVGIIGIVLHFKANAEFQREMDPSIAGIELFRKVVEATAPPALSPGVMVQLGLLGLVYTYRHPALREDPLNTRPDMFGLSKE